MSDKDPNYESLLFKALMTNLGIKKIRTSGYRPNANGVTEQSNTTTKTYLTAFLENTTNKNTWDTLLNLAAYAYNSSIHTATGYSPAELFFGRKLRVPLDILYGSYQHSVFLLSINSKIICITCIKWLNPTWTQRPTTTKSELRVLTFSKR